MGVRRLWTDHAAVVFGVSLVLLLLGVGAWLVLAVSVVKENVLSDFPVYVDFEADLSQERILLAKDLIAQKPYADKVDYISAEEALNRFKAMNPDELLTEEDGNIFSQHLLVTLNPSYASVDSLREIGQALQGDESLGVMRVEYNPQLMDNVGAGVNKTWMVALGILGLLLFISMAMINNTIRLSLYSNRFIIKTKQLVGATNWFIRKPFIVRSVLNGVLSAILAFGAFLLLLLAMMDFFPDFILVSGKRELLIIGGLLLVVGIVISVVSTFFALRRYLRMKLEDLY